MKKTIVLFFLLLLFTGTTKAQEYFEAIYIINFVNYIEWPRHKGQVRILVVGNSSLSQELRKLNAGGSDRLSVKSLKPGKKVDINQYQLIYISKNSPQGKYFFQKIRSQNLPIVIIGEKGSRAHIEFWWTRGRLGFFLREMPSGVKNSKYLNKLAINQK